MNILKYIEIPHVANYSGWRRKAIIVAAFPQECVRAIYGVYKGAQHWWRTA
ncbi:MULTISPECIES: hypothetical protein [unclassified Bradyrhizobium]|uniref:hypothetical protein n=1 Tax=unclassified Bradyrhizobium TaxID=2631580 RepID=UPI002915F36C|nr:MULTISPECIES: hypothetical protein [unclassified Bradyrhizobium]